MSNLTFSVRGLELEDRDGLLSLTAIFKLAGSPKNMKPAHWRQFPSSKDYAKTIIATPGRKGESYAPYSTAVAYAFSLDKSLGLDLQSVLTEHGIDTINLALFGSTRRKGRKTEMLWQAAIRDWFERVARTKIHDAVIDTEVPTPAGNIDILTPWDVIEVKQVSRWKGAVGQALCYRNYYPDHLPMVALFGPERRLDDVILANCTALMVICNIFTCEHPGQITAGCIKHNHNEIMESVKGG